MGRIKINEIDIDKGKFYMFYKELLTNKKYKGMKLASKFLYTILHDRLQLSKINNWVDKNGDIYLKFARKSIEELLCVSHPTACNAFKELVKCGLIDDVRIGVNKVNIIYVKYIELETVATTLMSKKLTSRSKKHLSQEVKNFNPIDTNSINTNLNDTNINKNDNLKNIISISEIKDSKVKTFIGFDAIIDKYTNNHIFKDTIFNFIKMRKTIRRPLIDCSLALLLLKLDKLASNDIEKIDILNYSILGGWSDIYEPKKAKTNEKIKVKLSTFNNFEQRNYDYEDLEKKLLGRNND